MTINSYSLRCPLMHFIANTPSMNIQKIFLFILIENKKWKPFYQVFQDKSNRNVFDQIWQRAKLKVRVSERVHCKANMAYMPLSAKENYF